MADPFVGEIRMFGGNFAPRSWAFCNGQLLAISQNTALFSLLGTYYGGNGTTTFALPNLQDRFPLNAGQGPGLTDRALGEVGGETSVTLTVPEAPSHSHVPNAVLPGSTPLPAGAVWAGSSVREAPPLYAPASAANTQMAQTAVGPSGGNQPHANVQPYLAVSYIIALQGVFPSRP